MARKSSSSDDVVVRTRGEDAGAAALLKATLKAVRELDAAQKDEARNAQTRARIIAQMRKDERDHAKEQEQNARRQAKAARDQAKVERDAAAASNRLARDRQRVEREAAAQTARNAAAMARANQASINSIRAMAYQVGQLALAFVGLRTIDSYIQRGLVFNQLIETSTLGIATLITASSKLETQDGRLLTGVEALTAAQGLARNEIDKIRIAGILTAATTEQLVVAFQEATAAGIKTGLTLEQIRNFTVQVSQAALAIGLPFNQLNQEVRSILNATIDRNSRIAKALQLTNEEVRLAKEQGRLAELLTQRFQAFTVAGEESLRTMAALRSNIADALDLFAGEQVKPLFTQLTRVGREALASIFDLQNAQIQDAFRGFIIIGQDIFREIGGALADGIKASIAGGETLSVFMLQAREGIRKLAIEARFVAQQFGEIVGAIIRVGSELVKSGLAGATLSGIMQVAAGAARLVADNMELISSVLLTIAIHGVIVAAIVAPLQTAIVAAALLLSYLRSISLERERQQQATLSHNEQFREESLQIIQLAAQYRAFAQIIRTSTDTSVLASNRQSLASVTARLIELEPTLREEIGATGDATLEGVAKVDAAVKHRSDNLIAATVQALDMLDEAKKRKVLLEADLADFWRADDNGEAEAQLEATNKEIDFLQRNVKLLADTGRDFLDSTLRARVETAGILANLSPRAGPEDAGGGGVNSNDPVQKARGELAAAKREAEAGQAELKAFYEAGQISAAAYYNGVLALQNKVFDFEEKLHQAEMQVGRSANDQGQIDQAKALLEAVSDERAKATTEANAKIAEADRELQALRIRIDEETAEALGDGAAASGAAIGRKYSAALVLALREGNTVLVQDIVKLMNLLKKKGQFEELTQQQNNLEGVFRDRVQRIENLQRTATISTLQAQKQTAAAYQDQIAALNQLLEAKQALGLQDEKSVAQMRALEAEIDNLTVELDLLTNTTTQLRVAISNDVEEGFTNVLATAFGDIQTGAHETANAFKSMARSIVQDINRIIAKMIAMAAVEAAISLVSDLVLGSSFLTGMAEGGPVRGPGGPRSDSVPIAASNGEFVVNARGYSAFPDIIEAINEYGRSGTTSRMRRYADGGLVSDVAPRTADGKTSTWDASLALTLQDGLVPAAIESPRGTKSVIRVIQQNADVIRRIVQTR